MINNWKNRTTKSRKNQNAWTKGKSQVLRNTGNGQHQTSGDGRKNKERVPQANEKISRNQAEIWSNDLGRTLVMNSELFLKCIREELRQIDPWTWKLMMIHKALHMRYDRDRRYESRKEGGIRLPSIEDLMNTCKSTKKYSSQHPITALTT